MFLIIITLISLVISTPPACFLSCINEIAISRCQSLSDLSCCCINEDSIIGCLIDICPYGVFLSARDHYIGTCLEHGKPTITNPEPPEPIYPSKKPKPSIKQDHTTTTTTTTKSQQTLLELICQCKQSNLDEDDEDDYDFYIIEKPKSVNNVNETFKSDSFINSSSFNLNQSFIFKIENEKQDDPNSPNVKSSRDKYN